MTTLDITILSEKGNVYQREKLRQELQLKPQPTQDFYRRLHRYANNMRIYAPIKKHKASHNLIILLVVLYQNACYIGIALKNPVMKLIRCTRGLKKSV